MLSFICTHKFFFFFFVRPGWFDGVTSMYAGEITLNDYFTTNELSDMQLQGESLDFGSDKYDLVGSQIHMHSWHGQLVNEKYTFIIPTF